MTFHLISEKLPVRDGDYDIKGIFPADDPYHETTKDQSSRKESFVAWFKSDHNAWYRVNPDTRSEPGNEITRFITEWAEIGVGDLPQGHATMP